MNRKSRVPTPEAITQLQRQLEQFRSTRPTRTKLPEPLWEAAVALARQHGIYAVAATTRRGWITPVEATAGRHFEPTAKSSQTSVYRTDRERRGNTAGMHHRV